MISARRLRRGARREAIGVDVAAALGLVGTIAKYLSLAFSVPIAVAVAYSEPALPWLAAGLVGTGGGWLMERLGRRGHQLGAREGFLIVSLTWLVAAALSALGYLLSGEDQLARPVDAYFESMSGFTTTGSTVLRDVEAVSHSLAIWRQLSQWLGGMGIIILAIAILPRLRIGGRQLLEAELPGPEIEQLTTRIRDTARRLWFLYVGLTVTAFLVLSLLAWTGVDPAMNTFEAAAHALTSIPTAGFSTEQASIGTFGAATQWAIVTFMVLGGANFALMYRALARRSARVIARDEELRLYLALLAAASIAIAAELLRAGTLAGEEAIRHGTFQAVSMMTTTGYSTINYDAWPLLALVLLIGLMFVGGSAGSTTGSVKVVRHLLMGKILHRELDQTVHPEIVSRIRLNRAAVDERTLRAITSFVLIYIGLFIVGTLLLSLDAERVDFDLRLIDAIGVAATALGNVGPAFGPAGPGGSFEPFSDFSKLVLIGLMWLGRLEIIPIIVLFTRNYWRA